MRIILNSLILAAVSVHAIGCYATSRERAGRSERDARPIVPPALSGTADDREVERTTWLMGTTLTARARTGTPARGFAAIEAAFDSVRAYEALLSTWREDTELARLNAAPVGQWVPLSATLARMLRATRRWSAMTEGAFDPSVGALVDAWDLRGRGRVPDLAALDRARLATGFHLIELSDSTDAARRLASGVQLDAGAFGKGAALAPAAAALRAHGIESAVLDFGGQTLVVGEARTVRIAHPDRRHEAVTRARLHDQSASTSGASERFVTVHGRRLGHLLDPRTGVPVDPWGSVTVIHPDPFVADILASALFVLGPEAGFAWAETHDIAAIFLLGDAVAGVAVRCVRAALPFLLEPKGCG